MRMWMVDPKLLCNKHLLGEHMETHMFVGTIRKEYSLRGYVQNGLVEPLKLQERHDALAAEMVARGMSHNSPLEVPKLTGVLDPITLFATVDPTISILELVKRCPECAKRIKDAGVYY